MNEEEFDSALQDAQHSTAPLLSTTRAASAALSSSAVAGAKRALCKGPKLCQSGCGGCGGATAPAPSGLAASGTHPTTSDDPAFFPKKHASAIEALLPFAAEGSEQRESLLRVQGATTASKTATMLSKLAVVLSASPSYRSIAAVSAQGSASSCTICGDTFATAKCSNTQCPACCSCKSCTGSAQHILRLIVHGSLRPVIRHPPHSDPRAQGAAASAGMPHAASSSAAVRRHDPSSASAPASSSSSSSSSADPPSASARASSSSSSSSTDSDSDDEEEDYDALHAAYLQFNPAGLEYELGDAAPAAASHADYLKLARNHCFFATVQPSAPPSSAASSSSSSPSPSSSATTAASGVLCVMPEAHACSDGSLAPSLNNAKVAVFIPDSPLGAASKPLCCTRCDQFDKPSNSVKNSECIHKSVAVALQGQSESGTIFPFRTVTVPTGALKDKSDSTKAVVFVSHQTPRHVFFCVLPVEGGGGVGGVPAMVQASRIKLGQAPGVRCLSCINTSFDCPHCRAARRSAPLLLSVKQGTRAHEATRAPQSSTLFDLPPYSTYPTPSLLETLPTELTPAMGGGCYETCPTCSSAFSPTPVRQCEVVLLCVSAPGQVSAVKRVLHYFPCSSPGCSGKNFYDGRLHHVAILTPRPDGRGQGGQDRAIGFELQTLAFLQEDILRSSVYQTWTKYFTGSDNLSRQSFNTLIQRFRLFLLRVPTLAPWGEGASVVDVCTTHAVNHNGCISGTTSAPPVHVCSPLPKGEFVNEHPLSSLHGSELCFMCTGLVDLGAQDLNLDKIRDFFVRLALSGTRARGAINPRALGWGTLSATNSRGKPLVPSVSNEELTSMILRLGLWCDAVEAAAEPPTAEYTCTALTLALALRSTLPLLASFVSSTTATDTACVPEECDSLLYALQSKFPHSAVARVPFIGAHFFPALVMHLESGGQLTALVPEAILCPRPAAVPGLRRYMGMHAHAAVSWGQALRYISPEVYKVSKGMGTLPPALLPILSHYGRLAMNVTSRRLRILLNEPVMGKLNALFKPFGSVSLSTRADRWWQYSLPVDEAAKLDKYKDEAAAIIKALEFEARGAGGSAVETRNVDARSGVHLPSNATFQRVGALHYLHTHSPQEASDCSSCARACTSIHCAEREDSTEGCDHNFEGKRGYTGGTLAMTSGENGAVQALQVLQHSESPREIFLLLNTFSSVREPTPDNLGMPWRLFYDSACHLCGYCLRRYCQRYMFMEFCIDDLHSFDHKVCACTMHFHKPAHNYLKLYSSVYASACEGLYSWLAKRCFSLTASIAVCRMALAHHCSWYNEGLQATAGAGEGAGAGGARAHGEGAGGGGGGCAPLRPCPPRTLPRTVAPAAAAQLASRSYPGAHQSV